MKGPHEMRQTEREMEGREETEDMEERQNGEGCEVCETRPEEKREARKRRKGLLLILVNYIFSLLNHISVQQLNLVLFHCIH